MTLLVSTQASNPTLISNKKAGPDINATAAEKSRLAVVEHALTNFTSSLTLFNGQLDQCIDSFETSDPTEVIKNIATDINKFCSDGNELSVTLQQSIQEMPRSTAANTVNVAQSGNSKNSLESLINQLLELSAEIVAKNNEIVAKGINQAMVSLNTMAQLKSILNTTNNLGLALKHSWTKYELQFGGEKGKMLNPTINDLFDVNKVLTVIHQVRVSDKGSGYTEDHTKNVEKGKDKRPSDPDRAFTKMAEKSLIIKDNHGKIVEWNDFQAKSPPVAENAYTISWAVPISKADSDNLKLIDSKSNPPKIKFDPKLVIEKNTVSDILRLSATYIEENAGVDEKDIKGSLSSVEAMKTLADSINSDHLDESFFEKLYKFNSGAESDLDAQSKQSTANLSSLKNSHDQLEQFTNNTLQKDLDNAYDWTSYI